LFMLFANMGLTFAVVFLAKDTKASGAGELTTLEGSAIRTNGVAAHGVLWDLPAIDGVYLAKLETVTVDATLSSAAAGSVWPPTVQATFGVASAIKPTAGGVVSTTEAFLTLVGGGLVYINRGTQGGYLTTTDGSNFTLGGTMRNATTGVQPVRERAENSRAECAHARTPSRCARTTARCDAPLVHRLATRLMAPLQAAHLPRTSLLRRSRVNCTRCAASSGMAWMSTMGLAAAGCCFRSTS
jgi:hypothetical protein